MTPTSFAIRIPAAEKAELEALAKQANVSLSDALRNGARVYLNALTLPQNRKGVRLGE